MAKENKINFMEEKDKEKNSVIDTHNITENIIIESDLKKQDNNKDNIIEITPVVDNETYGAYSNDLKKSIEDKEYVKNNIAIIGPYGSGKSSLIRTFDEEYKNPSDKSLYISLASFNSLIAVRNENNSGQNNVTTDNEEKDEYIHIESNDQSSQNYKKKFVTEQEIEKSILQQFLFKVNHREIPDSKISRIKGKHKNLWLIPLFMSVLLFALVFWKINKDMIFWNKVYPIISGLSIILSLISIFSLLFLFFNIFKFSKIKFKDIELGFYEQENSSLFNKYLDELIYFFKKTKYSIVYIEDLDRIGNSFHLFVKLRELNFVINNHDEIKNKVKFIYALGNDVLIDPEERTKFFDKIITIVPYLNINNVKDKLSQWISENSVVEGSSGITEQKTKEFIKNISTFLLDNRVLVNTYEDFLHYSKNVSPNVNFYELFSLMIYKNLFPADFSNLFYGRGELVNAFKLFDRIKNEERIKIELDIERLNNQIEVIENEAINSIEELKLLFAGYILQNGKQEYNQYNKWEEIDFDKVKEKDKFSINMSGYYRVSSFDKIDNLIKEKYGKFLKERYEIIKEKTEENKNAIFSKIEEKKQLSHNILNYTLQDCIKNLYSKEINDYFINNKFIGVCLSNSYIKENYLSMIAGTENTFITKNDRDFLINLSMGIQSGYDYKIDNPSIILLENETIERYGHQSILNYILVNYVLNSAPKDIQNNLIKYLNSNDLNVDEFISNYLTSQRLNDILILISHLNKKENLWTIIVSSIKNKTVIRDIVDRIIHNKIDFKIFNDKSFIKYINNINDLYKINFNQNLLSKFKKYGIKFKDLSSLKNTDNILEVVKEDFYDININNLTFISKLNGAKNIGEILNCLILTEVVYNRELFSNKIDLIIDLLKDEEQIISEENFDFLFFNTDITDTSKDILINNFRTVLTSIPNISTEYLQTLAERRMFKPNLMLLLKLREKIDYKYLSVYFNKNNIKNILFDADDSSLGTETYSNFIHEIIKFNLSEKIVIDFIVKGTGVNHLNISKLLSEEEINYAYDSYLNYLIDQDLLTYNKETVQALKSYTNSFSSYIQKFTDELITDIEGGNIIMDEEYCNNILLLVGDHYLKEYIVNNFSHLIKITSIDLYKSIKGILRKIEIKKEEFLSYLMSLEFFMNDKKFAFEILNKNISILSVSNLIISLSRFDSGYSNLLEKENTDIDIKYFSDNIKLALSENNLIVKTRSISDNRVRLYI